MLATTPIRSAWLARAARKERLILRQVAGILITFGGVGIVLAERELNLQGTTLTLVGDGFMLLTAFCGAAYGVLAQQTDVGSVFCSHHDYICDCVRNISSISSRISFNVPSTCNGTAPDIFNESILKTN